MPKFTTYSVAVFILFFVLPTSIRAQDIYKGLDRKDREGNPGGGQKPSPNPGPPQKPKPTPQDVLNSAGNTARNYLPTPPKPANGVRTAPPRKILTFEVCLPNDPVFVPKTTDRDLGIVADYGSPIPVSVREDLFDQKFVAGQTRKYYLSDAEYDQYTARFTYLKRSKSELYGPAIEAVTAWQKDRFQSTYFNIMTLATAYSASCNEEGEYSLVFKGLEPKAPPKQLEGKIAIANEGINKFVDAITDDAISKTLEIAAGADFAAAFGYVGSIYQFASMMAAEKRQKWFYNEATEEERDAVILRLLIRKIAKQSSTDSVRQAPQLEVYLSTSFAATYERHRQLQYYMEQERRLHPHQPSELGIQPKRMNAVPTP